MSLQWLPAVAPRRFEANEGVSWSMRFHSTEMIPLLAILLGSSLGLAAQNLTAIHTVSPEDVALIANNVTAHEDAPFQVYHKDFRRILGPHPSLSLLLEADRPYFHEGGIVTSSSPLTVFAISNQFNTSARPTSRANATTVLSRIIQDPKSGRWSSTVVNPSLSPLILPNGGTLYRDGLLLAAQGNLTAPGGLVYLPLSNLSRGETVINNYLGRPFNSPNDVYVTRGGAIYFTDPPYGYEQGIRPMPQLPAQVYAFVPGTTQVRVVADGMAHPNGITFSPDESTAYVTDTTETDRVTGLPAARTVYAFDVVGTPGSSHIGMLANRRVFAMVDVGIPDGVKCDARGNVYTGAGDGVNVYDPSGTLLGKIVVPGGTSNFAFGPGGRIFALNEKRLWLAQLDPRVQPAIEPDQGY